MKEIAKIQASIQRRHNIIFVAPNWDAASLEVVRLSMLLMERGLDRITGKRGAQWIHQNLGGMKISLGFDNSILGNQFIMQRVFNGRAHVIGNRVYLPGNFYASAWRKPRAKSNQWIIHELGHVWDNRSAHGWGSILGGGYGEQLLNYMGGRVKSFPLFRFVDNSLEIKRESAFNCGGNLDYGNNSPSDYFANTFVTAVVLPKVKGVPGAARDWMIELIRRTV